MRILDSQINLEDGEQTQTDLNKISEMINTILEQQDRNSRQLTQVLRENINFQNQVRQGMYDELETLKEDQRGEQFTPILKAVAAVCVEYRTLLNDETISKKGRRTLQLLFDELEDILSEYDAEIFHSRKGSQRKPLLTKIINTIATDDQKLHNTIAKSRRAGVIRNGRPLYREFVDVYVFDSTLTETKPKSEFLRSD
ncbi:MAG: hypothetical protein IK062_10505 [Selenomonadaceae bacterium]|nr:hypothetical protein [Selenomonadaceae bacterium]